MTGSILTLDTGYPDTFVFFQIIMANRTVKEAATVKGTNPQYLVEKIIRSRIYDSKFWKEDCFALTGKLPHYFVAVCAI